MFMCMNIYMCVCVQIACKHKYNKYTYMYINKKGMNLKKE